MDEEFWNPDFSCDDLLGKTLVSLHQTPWFSPCHRPAGAVVGAEEFFCRPVLELDGGKLYELAATGPWPFDPGEPHDLVDLAEHRLETVRPVLLGTVRAVLLARGVAVGGVRPLVVLDSGVTLGLDGPPGKRLWLRDLEDLAFPQVAGDGGEPSEEERLDFFDRPAVWTDARTEEKVDLRTLLPLRVAIS